MELVAIYAAVSIVFLTVLALCIPRDPNKKTERSAEPKEKIERSVESKGGFSLLFDIFMFVLACAYMAFELYVGAKIGATLLWGTKKSKCKRETSSQR